MAVASPGTVVAAVFSADVFGPDVSESAVIIAALRAGVKDFLRRPLSSADLGQLIDRLTRRAILAPQRSNDLPDVPTMDEAGINGLNVDSWIGLFAPAGTPKAVIDKLQSGIAASSSGLKAKFVAGGADYMWVPPEKLDGFVHAEYEKWTKLIKDAGITLE